MPAIKKYAPRKFKPKSKTIKKMVLPKTLGTLFPSSLVVSMPYHHESYLAVSSGAGGIPAYYQFRANSCYDPDVTGAGHQPRGFDQFFLMFDHAMVTKSKCTVKVIPDYNNAYTLLTQLNLNTVNTARTQEGLAEDIATVSCLQNQATDQKTLVLGYDHKRNYPRLDDGGLSFTDAADAGYIEYFTVQTQIIGGIAATAVVAITVDIVYECRFFDPKQPPSS